MKRSEFLDWIRISRPHVRYNLAGSGVPPCPLEDLDPDLADLTRTEPNLFGWEPLVARIAARYGVAERQVMLAHSASMANHLVYAALLEPGDEVLIERPVYEPLVALARYLRAEVHFFDRVPEDRWRLDPGRVRARLSPRTRLVVLTHLHNPTGAHAGPDRLAALAALAEERGFHALVDEVFLEWLHDAGEGTAARLSARILTTRSLGKAYGLDSLRVGWILGDPAVLRRVEELHNLFYATLSHPSERLAARAFDRLTDAALERGRRLLDPEGTVAHNRRLVADFIAADDRLSWVEPAAGAVGFVRLAGGAVDALVERLEREHQTLVAPGRFFGDPGAFRLGFGMETAVLEEGLRRLRRALT